MAKRSENKKKKAARAKPSSSKKKKSRASSKKTAKKVPSVEAGARHWPRISPECFVHPAAVVEGLAKLGHGCSIWGGAVVRADMNHIELGRYVNIQDNCTLHVDSRHPMTIGEYTLVGHNAMLHGCKIGKACLIGIGCIVLDGAEIGDGAMVTAGCLIRGGKKIPPRAMVVQKHGELKIIPNRARPYMTIAGSLEYVALKERQKHGEFIPFTPAEEEAFAEEARQIAESLGLGEG